MERKFIIDVETYCFKKIFAALQKLSTTKEISDGGKYHQDQSYSQIHISSTLTEDELDTILCNRKDTIGYVGVIEKKEQIEEPKSLGDILFGLQEKL